MKVNDMPKLSLVQAYSVELGTDPELFFKDKDGNIVGAEHIIPKEGLVIFSDKRPRIVIDGVQLELHPTQSTCRESLTHNLRAMFHELAGHLENNHKGISVSFEQSITMTEKEFERLSEENKVLGCNPSFNAYGDNSEKLARVEKNHMQRSAGGHIHLGLRSNPILRKLVHDEPETLVKMLDIICGNTCVLVDRDEGNITRRQLYGFAGEYRLPDHGLEYRVLSNFWLRHYSLLSLAFGLARTACDMACYPDVREAILKAVDFEKVQQAINTNDFDLAMENFKSVMKIWKEVCPDMFGRAPIDGNTMKEFLFFVNKIKRRGIKYWFKKEPFKHWTGSWEGYGFNQFLRTTVNPKMPKPAVKVAVKSSPGAMGLSAARMAA